MRLFKRIWFRLVQTVLDAALSAVIKLRKTALPPKPIVWHDPRPYRNWRLDLLVREFANKQAETVINPEDSDDKALAKSLLLEEILVRHGQKPQPLHADG